MYTEQQLAELVASVEKEFNAELAKAEASVGEALAKAEEAPAAKEDEKSEQKPEEKPAEESKEAAAPEGKEAAAPEAPAAEEKPAEEAPAADSEGHDYDEEDLAEMQKMYSSMSKGELKAHHDACRQALDSLGMQKCGEMHMAKSEETVVVEVPAEVTKEVETLKAQVATEMAKAEEFKKNFEAVSEFLTKLVNKTAPQGKAITNLDTIAKSEVEQETKTLTKSEVTAILTKKGPASMTKADRELVNAYYSGSGSLESINHLLK